jgi:hypothetical protein
LKRTGIGEALQLAVARPRIAHLGRRRFAALPPSLVQTDVF